MKITNKATTIIFCAVIALLTVASLFNPVRSESEVENRQLAQMPELSIDALFDGIYSAGNELGKFTSNYEKFVTDQFVARDSWISVKTSVELALGKRDTNGVYFADDGYFIEQFTPDDAIVSRNIGFINSFLDFARDKYNVRVLIAPTASLVHSDKLPPLAPNWNQDEMLDNLAKSPEFVDTRDQLIVHKDEYIYYRTDHHWTTLGAYYAYCQLMESLDLQPVSDYNEVTLSENFLGTVIAKVGIKTEPDTLTTFESKSQPTVSLDFNLGMKTSDSLYAPEKLETRDKYGVFLGGNDAIVDIKTSTKNGRMLLMVKDSYAHCMVPLLVNNYERIILIDLRYYNLGVESYLASLEADGTTVDDVIVLYNANSFADDRYLLKITK
ncbi:MAG: hypothetical protein HFE63_08940 [Clostridiales bacterium]|nr:hypothetical protein [Clostridiales bacterium]